MDARTKDQTNTHDTSMAPHGNWSWGVTALMGERAAHVCTDAVETVIERHYDEQIQELERVNPEWTDQIRPFRDDERRHRDEAIEKGSLTQDLPPHLQVLRFMITKGCQAAIKISEKV